MKLSTSEFNKTNIERNYFEMIKNAFLGYCTGVDLSYSSVMKLVQEYLKKIYGDLVNWERSISDYMRVIQNDKKYKVVNVVDDLQLVSEDVLMRMIDYDILADKLAQEAKECIEKWKSDKGNLASLVKACTIFGILPSSGHEIKLNHFLVPFPKKKEEVEELRTSVLSNSNSINLLGRAADMLSLSYNSQYYATFPFVGTMIMQPKRNAYYRGENAYYGTSRPSFYRNKLICDLPYDLQRAVLMMKYDECGIFVLDRFDVIKDWTRQISDCNFIALMQHYGLPTTMIDITSDLKVALFFACCKLVGKGRLAHWEPLRQAEFERIDSRRNIAKKCGDSRFGIIYRTSSELEDLLWMMPPDAINKGLSKLSSMESELAQILERIIPIGYQPFSRTRLQSAYMLLVINPKYDMLKDIRFAKIRFRLTENLCEWIYSEMDKGNKIYPKDGTPELEKYLKGIANNPTVFSKSTFNHYCEKNGITARQAQELEKRMLDYGYIISNHDLKYIPDEDLRQINKYYTLDIVKRRFHINPSTRPLICI